MFCPSLNDLRKTKNSRVYSVCIGLALLSQNYWCRLTSTLYKPDTSLRRTVGVGPDGVRLRESSLYYKRMLISYQRTPSYPESSFLLTSSRETDDLVQSGQTQKCNATSGTLQEFEKKTCETFEGKCYKSSTVI